MAICELFWKGKQLWPKERQNWPKKPV